MERHATAKTSTVSLAKSGANPFVPFEVAEQLQRAAEALQRDGEAAREPQE